MKHFQEDNDYIDQQLKKKQKVATEVMMRDNFVDKIVYALSNLYSERSSIFKKDIKNIIERLLGNIKLHDYVFQGIKHDDHIAVTLMTPLITSTKNYKRKSLTPQEITIISTMISFNFDWINTKDPEGKTILQVSIMKLYHNLTDTLLATAGKYVNWNDSDYPIIANQKPKGNRSIAIYDKIFELYLTSLVNDNNKLQSTCQQYCDKLLSALNFSDNTFNDDQVKMITLISGNIQRLKLDQYLLQSPEFVGIISSIINNPSKSINTLIVKNKLIATFYPPKQLNTEPQIESTINLEDEEKNIDLTTTKEENSLVGSEFYDMLQNMPQLQEILEKIPFEFE